jgi:hypothetical protein
MRQGCIAYGAIRNLLVVTVLTWIRTWKSRSSDRPSWGYVERILCGESDFLFLFKPAVAADYLVPAIPETNETLSNFL